MDAASSGDLGVLRELSLPAIGDTVLTKLAILAREGRGEATAVVLELVRVVRIRCDVVAEGTSGIGRITREDATDGLAQVLQNSISCQSYLISKEMNSLKPVPDCWAAV